MDEINYFKYGVSYFLLEKEISCEVISVAESLSKRYFVLYFITAFIFKYLFGKIRFGETPFSSVMHREDSGFNSSGWSSQVTLRTKKEPIKKGKKVIKVIPDKSKKVSRKAPSKVSTIDSDRKTLLSLSMPKHTKKVIKKTKTSVSSIDSRSNVLSEETDNDIYDSLQETQKDSLEPDKNDDLKTGESDSNTIFEETVSEVPSEEQQSNEVTSDNADDLNASSDKVIKETHFKSGESNSDKVAPDKQSVRSDNTIEEYLGKSEIKSDNFEDVCNEPSIASETNKQSNDIDETASDTANIIDAFDEKPVSSYNMSSEMPTLVPDKETANMAPVQSNKADVSSGDNRRSVSEDGSEENPSSEDGDIGALFKLIDPDGDGFITLDKLRRVM